jgi:hypothetical protein
MDSISFGSPLNEKIGKQDEVSSKDVPGEPFVKPKNPDIFDKLTSGMNADGATALAKFLKRFIPVLVFIVTVMFGIGVGRTDLVSGCLRGLYGEVSLLFGIIEMPLYSDPGVCLTPDKARDFISIKPLIFLVSFILVFAIWSYFDRKLAWRGKGNYEKF